MSRPAYAVRLVAFLVVALLVPVLAAAAFQRRYDTEYEAIQYASSAPTDSVARLQQRVLDGESELRFDADTGYLASLLEALDIDVASQMLVFSRTSLQVQKISPATPRAIYFNDDTYVAWVPGGLIEISSVDPKLGVVFYTLESDAGAQPRFERHTVRCLNCHDSYSLTGGGVPRHLVGSGFIDETGALASHESWILTTDRSPISRRWGGWYVTGTHGEQVHRGNLIIRENRSGGRPDPAATGNVTNLDGMVDTGPYLGDHSDIVALMVLEHQTHVQNVITRVNWDTRTALHEQRRENLELGRDESFLSEATLASIEAGAEPLVQALLLVDEAPLTDRVAGTSGFAARFEELGPYDDDGRSLRQLDLRRRLFRYPCSYVIYSRAFQRLPQPAKDYVYRRIGEVLTGDDRSEEFDHLSSEDRAAILEILEQTSEGFAARSRAPVRGDRPGTTTRTGGIAASRR